MNRSLTDVPRSRVFTTGFKLFSGLAAVGLLAALFTGLQSCGFDLVGWEYPPVTCSGEQGLVDSFLGPMTLGWKGGVGDHLIYTIWVGLAASALLMAGLMTAYRDADPQSVAEAARTEIPPPANPPQHISFWPAIAAFSGALAAIGLVANPATFVGGMAGLGLCVVMWAVRNWAESTTGDPDVNEQVHERISVGLELPLVALVIVGAAVISISRILLTVGRLEAVAVAGGVAGLIFVLGAVVAYGRRLGKNVIAAIVVVVAVAILVGGAISATRGEREFHDDKSSEHSSQTE